MGIFIVVAALVLALAVGAVVVPLLKSDATPAAPGAAAGAAALLVLGSALLYSLWSNWTWSPPPPDSPATMVASLARKLERNPQDLEGWLKLGRSYTVLQENGLALRAYERADRLAGGKSAEALLGQAEALVQTSEEELGGRAGTLVEKALLIAPDDPKGLIYGAAVAIQHGQLPLARQRFEKLLASNPPDNVRTFLHQQIAAIDQQLASTGTGGGGATTARASGPAVRVTVQLPPGGAAPTGSPLFVLVRDPARPGPPLAVKRLESHFPQTVELTPADSMMGGQGFVAGQKVQVVARIARSGGALAKSGDPFGEVAYLVGKDGLVNITINQVTP